MIIYIYMYILSIYIIIDTNMYVYKYTHRYRVAPLKLGSYILVESGEENHSIQKHPHINSCQQN